MQSILNLIPMQAIQKPEPGAATDLFSTLGMHYHDNNGKWQARKRQN